MKLTAVIMAIFIAILRGNLPAYGGQGTSETTLGTGLELFESAKSAFDERKYEVAGQRFEEFLARYPGSTLALEAELLLVDCRVRTIRRETPAEGTEENEERKVVLVVKEELKSLGGPGEAALSSPPVTINFGEYVANTLKTNPGYLVDREEFNRYYVSFVSTLQAYNFNVSLAPSATAYYDDDRVEYGADFKIDITKTLYDGGKRGILEKELDIVRNLSRVNLIDSRNNTILIAANRYSTFYYAQEEISLLKRNFLEYGEFMRRLENSYQMGTRISSFDYYSSKSQHLQLERELLNKKSALLKAEAAFRQFGHIYTKQPLRLAPISISRDINLEELEKAALTGNSSIRSARMRNELQMQRIEEKKADRGLTVKFNSSLGVQVGSGDYTGSGSSGSGTNPIASVGISATLPLFDGGVRRSNILAEEIESLKQRLAVQKTTEDIVRALNDLRTDYITLERDLEISRELMGNNRRRLNIAMERFEKGLEEYRSVRESWNDSLMTEIDVVRQEAILRKMLVDMSILSGKNVPELCRVD
jgi:outer membrane protein TolC